jgi:hypothetical protein
MPFTCGAWLLGHTIIVQVNNINTRVQVIHQVLQTKKILIYRKRTTCNIHKIHIHTIHIFDVNKNTMHF